MPEALSAFCGSHATAPAVATCKRCGLFLCEACVVIEGDEGYCASCAALRNAPPSFFARASVFGPGLAIASTLLLFMGPLAPLGLLGPPLLLFGLAAGVTERRRLKGQDAPRARRWLRAGAWLALPALVVLLPLAAWLIWEVGHHRH